MMHKITRTLLALALFARAAAAMQDPAITKPAPAAPRENPWEINGSIYYSDPPNSPERVTLIGYADRGPLHLEGRYGYEDVDTLALFAGWTFGFGEQLRAELTPMIGAVMGDTDGFAPGLEADIGWKRLNFYTEAEYLFDNDDSDDDFFYSWSTLMFAFNDSLSAGLVAERSKIVDTDFSVQRGLAVQYAGAHVGFSVYAYNLDSSDDSYAVASVSFAP